MSGKRIGNLKISTSVLSKMNQQGVPKTSNDRSVAVATWDIIDERLVDLNVINANPCCSEISATAKDRTGVAINTTALGTIATVTSGIQAGLITSTSAATVSIQLPTATQLATSVGAAVGTTVDFIVDNSGGASIVTVAVGAGITAAKQVSDGDAAINVLLTVTANTTPGGCVGMFRVYFTSTTTAILYRVG